MGVSKGQLYDSKSCECNIVRIQDRHMDKIVDVQNHQGHGAADRAGFSSAGQEEQNGCSSRNWHLALGS